jgi:serine/threonine-protein kinase
MLGKEVLHYKAEKLLNMSSMSTVYLASDIRKGTPATLKVYNPYLVRSTRLAKHLKNSVPLISSLHHPNIVHIYELAELTEGIGLVMEYVDGITLANYIDKADRELAEEEIMEIFLQILGAIALAHRRGLLHTDIKPSNIFISTDKKVKVSFCSTSRLLSTDTMALSKAGFKIGNVCYKSPEQIYEKPLDARTDIYSAGVVLYELLTGDGPYARGNCSEFEIQNKIVYEPLFKDHEIRQGIRGKLQMLVNTATAKNPDERFADADEFIIAVQEIQNEEREKQYQEMLREVSVNSIQSIEAEDGSVITVIENKKKSRKIAGIFAVFTLMATCFFIITLLYQNASKSASREIYAAAQSVDMDSVESNQDSDSTVADDSVSDTEESVPPEGVTTLAAANTSTLAESELQYRLENYYKAMETKDPDRLAQYYAPSLIRFFNEYGVSDELLNQLQNQAWERTPEAKYNVLWETFRYSRDEKGNYVVDYYMNYKYRRPNQRGWKTRKIYTMLKMNKDLQIYYITGD